MNQISFSFLANFSSAVPWGLWVAVYVWLVGISCGAFVIVMWGNVAKKAEFQKWTRLGVMLAVSTLMAGLIAILIDLGHMERFYKLFIEPSPTAVMAWMVWLYNIYFILLAAITLVWLKKGIPGPIAWFSALYAIAVIIIESLLFARPPGRAWHSPIFVICFLTASLAAGAGAMILAAALFRKKQEREKELKALARIAMPLVILNLIAVTAASVSEGAVTHPWNITMLLLSAAASVLLFIGRPVFLTTAAVITLVSTLAAKYGSIISAQAAAPYRGFEKAYIEPRLAYCYSPSMPEIAIAAGLVALAAAIFYILYRVFPLTREA